MNKSHVYLVVIALLVICNGILGFFLFTQPGPPPHGHPNHKKPKEIVAEKLGFSEDQMLEYEEAIQDHRQKISELEENLRHLKDDLFATVLDENAATAESLAIQIGEIQTNIELLHVEHFKDIKSICTADQMDEFEALVKELGKIFAPHHAPPPKK